MNDSANHFERTRQTLLARMKDFEDQAAWQEFFNSYWRLIYSAARKSGLTDDEAQDAVQETILELLKRFPRFDYQPAKGSFKSWLMVITRQRIARQLGKRLPAGHPPPADADTRRTATMDRVADSGAPPLEAVWDAEWQEHLMGAALAQVKSKVKPRQYQIFDLVVVQQWPVDEVARTLGLNRAQVYLAKHRVGALVKQAVNRLEQLAR